MAIENFLPGTLIIPMDATYQNLGMYRAYGLVYNLLSNGIPVKWVIRTGKPFNGTDFTASATDFQTAAPIISHNYSGGPFIIDSAFAAAAAPFITAWQAANPNVKVHVATTPFSADIAATMQRPPRIAVEATNAGIVLTYLNAAGIPDSNGNVWTTASPGVLSETEIGAGALFGYDLTACRRNAYDIFLSPHTGTSSWDSPALQLELNDWLYQGGFLHAMCASIPSIENTAGPFLTQSGIPETDTNKGDTGTFTVTIPDFPTVQAVNTTNPQGLPGGSFQTVYHNTPGLVYNPQTQILAYFVQTSTGKQYDFIMAGPYKNGNGAGKVVYEGGHSYTVSLPYTGGMENMYTRFVLDDVFFAVGKPLMYLEFNTGNPNNELFVGQPNNITFSIVNTGASPALSTGFTVTLIPGMTYNNDATIPPTSVVGQTLTWSPAALGNVPPGTVLTFTATYTPPGVGTTQLATFSTSFGDEQNENYNIGNQCVKTTAVTQERPVLDMLKAVDKEFATYGDTLTYTVNVVNNGNVTATNVVFTDPIPAGTTFVPGSVTVNGIPDLIANPSAGIPLPDIPPSPSPGSTVVVTFQVTVNNMTTPQDVINQAFTSFEYTVDGTTFSGTAQSNTVVTVIRIGQLTLVKSTDKTVAAVGDIITYTTEVTNTGNAIAFNTTFFDNPPAGTNFIPGTVYVNGVNQPGASPIAGIPLGDLPVSTPDSPNVTTVSFQVQVTSIPSPPIFTNIANATFLWRINPADQPTIPGSGTSNPVETQAVNPQITIVKSVNTAFANIGDVITFTSVVTNTGDVTANNVVFTDAPPAGTTFVPGSVTIDGSPSAANPSAGIPLGNMAPGASITVTFQATATSVPVPNPTINTSSASGFFTINPGEPPRQLNFNSNEVPVTIENAFITTTKSVDLAFAEVGDTLTYTVVINNPGTTAANNVVLTDVVPNGTTFVPGSVTINGAPSGANPSAGIPIGNIPAGGSATVTFQAQVTSIPVPNPAVNVGTVTALLPINPNNPTPVTANTNPVPTQVSIAQVDVIKSVDKAFAEVGDILTYTVTMNNVGTIPANSAVLTDIVPNGTTFVPGTLTINGAPSSANPNAGVPLGNIPAGGSVTVIFQAQVTSTPVPNPAVNIATLSALYPINPSSPVLRETNSNPVPTKVETAGVNVVKTVDKAFAEVGDVLTYTTTITNPGTVPATNVVFTDTPPNGTSFIPGTIIVNGFPVGGNPSAGIPLADIPVGGITTVTFQVTVNAIPVPNPAQNISVINALYPVNPQSPTPKTTESNPAPTQVSIAQLNVVKTVDKAFAEVCQNLTYTITITNTGTIPANNVVVTDPPPNGTSFVGGTVIVNGIPDAAANPSTGINVPSIPAGGTAIITFVAHADFVPVPNPTSNISIVSASFPVNPANPVEKEFPSNPADTTIQIARVDIVKTVDKPTALVGDTVTYTVVLTNTGTVPANNVVFTDTPPAGTTFVPGSVTINGLPAVTANPAAGINLGTIPVGGFVTVTFQATVDSIPTPNPTINIAAATGSFPVNPNNPTEKGFESNPVPVQVEKIQLNVVKSADKPFAEIGETVTYTVAITNAGTITATNVVFTDTPPAGTAFVPGSVTINGAPSAGNPSAGIPLPNIPAGGTVIVTFQATVVSVPTPNPSENIAVVNASFVVVPGQPPVLVTVPSNPVEENIINAQLSVEKAVNKTAAVVGDTLTYTVTVTNTGNVNANNVTVFDLVPAGAVFVPNSLAIDGIPQPGVNPNNGVSLGTLTPGQTKTITFEATITSRPEPPEIVNMAAAEFQYVVNPAEPPRSKTQESNEVVTTVEIVELTLVKSAVPDRVVLGDVITYTIVATNTGTVPINNVIFRDEIPAGTSYVPNSFTIGGVPVPGANPAEGVNLGTINPGQIVTITFQVRYDYLPCPPIIRNIASAEFNFRLVTSGPVETGTTESNETETEAAQTNFKQISVSETVCIPPQKPEAEDILNVLVDVEIIATRVIKTTMGTSQEGQNLTGYKLIIEGMLHQKIEYIADEPTQSVHAAEFNVPFSSFIILPENFNEHALVNVVPYVEDIYFKQISPRCIFKNVTLRLEAEIIC